MSDNFNRADVSPLDGNWEAFAVGQVPRIQISGNRAEWINPATYSGACWLTPIGLEQTQEADIGTDTALTPRIFQLYNRVDRGVTNADDAIIAEVILSSLSEDISIRSLSGTYYSTVTQVYATDPGPFAKDGVRLRFVSSGTDHSLYFGTNLITSYTTASHNTSANEYMGFDLQGDDIWLDNWNGDVYTPLGGLMAAPLSGPKFQAFANDGSFLVGGKLYTYEPGTTTPKATYTTSALSVANANPVILDSRGEANVWPDGATKYVLKDSADNTLWTVDNVGTPAFQAYSFRAHKNGTDQTGVASATATKVTFGTESWDVSNWYDTGTSRYTPQIEGYYRIRFQWRITGGLVDQQYVRAYIYKNGSAYEFFDAVMSGTSVGHSASVDCLVAMNGTTDYVEAYVEASGAGNKTVSGVATATVFSGHLVEAI